MRLRIRRELPRSWLHSSDDRVNPKSIRRCVGLLCELVGRVVASACCYSQFEREQWESATSTKRRLDGPARRRIDRPNMLERFRRDGWTQGENQNVGRSLRPPLSRFSTRDAVPSTIANASSSDLGAPQRARTVASNSVLEHRRESSAQLLCRYRIKRREPREEPVSRLRVEALDIR